MTTRPDDFAPLSYASGTGATPLLGDTVGRDLARAVAAFPGREALVDVPSGRRWTYAEFGAAVDTTARALIAAGAGEGDRVGVWAVNCPERVLVRYATARIGAVLVNINPAYRTHELAYVLRQAGIELLIASTEYRTSDYRAMADPVRARCPGLRRVVHVTFRAGGPGLVSASCRSRSCRGRRTRRPRGRAWRSRRPSWCR